MSRIAALFLLFMATATDSTAQASKAISTSHLTAQQVIDRIKTQVGVTWQNETVDTFKAGNSDTPVTGIAVTMMATMDVLQRAVAAGDNLIITHEPTFYSHLDNPDELPMKESDPVLAEKRAYIEKHHLIIWRFHDHWHRRNPDGIKTGILHDLGWEKYEDPAQPYLFTIPETTVGDLAVFLTTKLAISNIRIVGNRKMKLTRVALSPGAAGFARETGALELPDVQVLILGETREWETVEYVADAVSEGRQKALIVLSHVPSEQAGMEECTRWLKTFVNEVPVQFVPTADPFAAQSTLLKRPQHVCYTQPDSGGNLSGLSFFLEVPVHDLL
jgi:putative NIF3 family GTP cyclohydrolase 1 type 2